MGAFHCGGSPANHRRVQTAPDGRRASTRGTPAASPRRTSPSPTAVSLPTSADSTNMCHPDFEAAGLAGHVCQHLTQFAQVGLVSGLGGALGRPQRRPHLGRAKGQPGGVEASAPWAGAHLCRHQCLGLEPLAHAPRLCSPFFAQVALGAAVTDAKPRWVECARRQCMPKGHHHAARTDQVPGVRVGGPDRQGGAQASPQQRTSLQHAYLALPECPAGS